MNKLERGRFFELFCLYLTAGALLFALLLLPLYAQEALPVWSAPSVAAQESEAGLLHSLFAEAFTPISVLLGVFWLLTGTGLLVFDVKNGLMEFLLSRPVSRTVIFLRRVLSALSAMLAGNIGLFALCAVYLFWKEPPVSRHIDILLSTFLRLASIQLVFFFWGLLWSASVRRPLLAILGALFSYALLYAAGESVRWGLPAFILYFSPNHIVSFPQPNLVGAGILLGFVLCTFLAGLLIFRQRELSERRPRPARLPKS